MSVQIVDVRIIDDGHKYAERSGGALQSAQSGPFELLYVSEYGSEVRKCVVRGHFV